MTACSLEDTNLELHFGSPSGIDYSLTRHILSSPDFPPCSSYTLTVTAKGGTVVLDDLTVHRDRARRITENFFHEEVLPENIPYIVEDLLADEGFVC